MLKVKRGNRLRVPDLKEGDIAEIEYEGVRHIVYIYRSEMGEPLSMLSLSHKANHWTGPLGENMLPVLRVFKSGDTLEIA